MKIFSKQSGYQVKLVDVVRDDIRDVNGVVHSSYYIKAVFDDERLSSKLNGKNAFGPKWEKAIYALSSPEGQKYIEIMCEEFLKTKKG